MAVGDPSLVRRLRRGGTPRLGTADRVLAFLGEAPVVPAFLLEVEAFVKVTRTKKSVFSRESSGNQSFLTQLRRGALPRLDTADRVKTWMRTNCTVGEWEEIRSRVAAGLPEPRRVRCLGEGVEALVRRTDDKGSGGGHGGAGRDDEERWSGSVTEPYFRFRGLGPPSGSGRANVCWRRSCPFIMAMVGIWLGNQGMAKD